MGRGGGLPCPTCKSRRTKTARGRRAQQTREMDDGSVVRGHRCEDCGILFLSVQRPMSEADAEAVA